MATVSSLIEVSIPHLTYYHCCQLQNVKNICSYGWCLICLNVSFILLLQLKRWERKECKPNSLPVLQKMHVRLGDTVKVIAGNEKGKIGEIIRLFKHNSTVIVKDMNIKTKHVKSKEQGEPGQIVKVEGPIHSSNVMLYSKEKEVHSRVGHKILEDGSRVRYLIKTGEIIDNKDDWKRFTKEKKQELEKVEA
ncbi:hypothetical protein MKW94_020056 [Papaver nudicaule]|uniref:KOW domain-containing protein n=1 Tax=Papaver nudicaule TaxID=74823 RepID=A0AA41W1V5_PAPNU|nr:hypothetical protein [Papaver nudicaule]